MAADIERERQHHGGEQDGEPGDFKDDGAPEYRQDPAQCRSKDEPCGIGAGEPAVGDPALALGDQVGDGGPRARSKRGGAKALDEA